MACSTIITRSAVTFQIFCKHNKSKCFESTFQLRCFQWWQDGPVLEVARYCCFNQFCLYSRKRWHGKVHLSLHWPAYNVNTSALMFCLTIARIFKLREIDAPCVQLLRTLTRIVYLFNIVHFCCSKWDSIDENPNSYHSIETNYKFAKNILIANYLKGELSTTNWKVQNLKKNEKAIYMPPLRWKYEQGDFLINYDNS